MKRLVINTDLKIYGSEALIKPTMPLFTIKNNGGLPVTINNNFTLLPQQTFAIHLPHLVARFHAKGYRFECSDEFKINWQRPMTFLESGLSPIAYAIYIVVYSLNKRISYQHSTLTTT